MTNLITSTKNVSLTGDQKVDGLFAGAAWDGTITYAFPTTSASYAYSGEKDNAFSSISSQQQSFALFFMEQSYGNAANDGFSVEGFTNASFVAGNESNATVRFAQSSLPSTAWAYTPVVGGVGGDVWFGTAYAGTQYDLRFPGFGNYAGHTVAHELGHALGLKHAQEAYGSNMTVVPAAYDSLEYTIMTYRTYVGDDLYGYKYENDSAPQTFMMLDIAALQEMYGADYTTNSGNTVYTWNPNQGITYVNGVAAITPDANRIFATVWDGGGIDTYDLSAYSTALNIDLQPGSYSVFSQGQLADLNGGPNGGYARGNIFNALLYHGNLASLIENVQAGSGNDTIVGNEANNTFWGNAGNDWLIGGAGNDTLDGGTGTDTLIGGTGTDTYIVDNAADVVTENASEGTDTVLATISYTLGANVENLTYTGTGAFSGIGNGLDNTIIGGAASDTLSGGTGNDLLNGSAGADTMIGGAGDDIYAADNAGDVVTENAGQGTDTVRTNLASYTLGANLENLTYNGTATFAGIGNSLDNVIIGGAGSDTLSGGVGNDLLNGSAGADTMIGGAGDDIYAADNAGDVVTENAGQGTDTVRTNLASYTLGANLENLTYNGTATFAGTGNSLDNVIIGGAGSDTLSGGVGNDLLNGSAGGDTMIGGAGDDIYAADNAGDVVTENAGQGTDTVRTNLASYTLGANLENLTYNGTATFAGIGNSLDNVIIGGAGSDTLSGGVGNDLLNGSAGADTMIGGAGDDIYAVDNVGDSVTENASEGTDMVRTNLASYTLGANVENLTYNGTATFAGTGNSLDNLIIGGAASDTLSGGDGNDTLNGSAGADTLIGGAGDDIYAVENAGDSVTESAAAGTDMVRTNLASYTLGANVENLTYNGTATFTGTGNDLANTIRGAAGADVLDGKVGADILIGAAGNDIYVVDDLGDLVTEGLNEGTDLIRTVLSSYALTNIANVENLTFIGTGDFIGTGNSLVNAIAGGVGNDTLDGGAGNDTLIGGAGNDIYMVDSASDVIDEAAGAGTDEIRTSLATYSIAALTNVETLTYTGSASFTGIGNALDNTITGGDGNDTLNGSAGADTLIGGAGDDIYAVDNVGDSVTENASEGTDMVRTNLASYTLGANVENLTYNGTATFAGTGNSLDNLIIGGAASDTLSGGDGNDTLNGSAGADTLIGGAGDDIYAVENAGDSVTESAAAGTDMVRTNLASYTLGANVENLTYNGTATFAGTGNDLANTITGGNGGNTLTGGAGDDILIGGAAADFFIYSPNWGHDTITNFVATGTAHDTIRIDHSVFADWASLLAASSQSGSDTIVTADINNTITLKNVAVSSLESTDFQFA